MRVWIYGRLSNDDDIQMDSLENQMEIGRSFADSRDYSIIGESFDDNVSGMRFDREGLNQVTQVADAGKIDAVIVKDLSRLGRHKILRTPPRNDSWTAKVRHLDRLKQTPLPSVRQLEKLAWRPA